MELLKIFKRKKTTVKPEDKEYTPDEMAMQVHKAAKMHKVEQIYGEGVYIDLPGWRKDD